MCSSAYNPKHSCHVACKCSQHPSIYSKPETRAFGRLLLLKDQTSKQICEMLWKKISLIQNVDILLLECSCPAINQLRVPRRATVWISSFPDTWRHGFDFLSPLLSQDTPLSQDVDDRDVVIMQYVSLHVAIPLEIKEWWWYSVFKALI